MSYEIKILTGSSSDDEIRSFSLEDYEIEALRNYERNYLGIFIDGVFLKSYCDNGEPEDNSFSRDWYWVDVELERAYRKGLEDGRV